MVTYAIGFGIAAGALAALIVFLNAENKNLNSVGIVFAIAGGITALLMSLLIWMFLPTFVHWSDSGYTLGFYVVLVVGGLVGGITSFNEYGENNALALSAIVVILLMILRIFPIQTFQMGIGPNPCNGEETRNVVSQLLTFETVSTLGEVQESSVEKISSDRSLQLARNKQPQELRLGEYLTVDNGYEQLVNGKPMNVHPMKPKDIGSYQRFGNKTPGFLLVDASRSDGSAQWVDVPKGKEIYYISGDAPWKEYDLYRHVYFNYVLPKGVQVWDMTGPEVTDDLKFIYVGTVMKPSAIGGAKYYMPTGVITVDAHSGKIQEYSLEEIPEKLPFLDRILPADAALQLIGDYAIYRPDAAVCNAFTNSGQWEINEQPIITTRGGKQVMQFFLTTKNNADPIVQEVIYLSPRDMTAKRFPGNGMLVNEKTRTLVEKKANPNLKPELYSVMAKEPTHMWFGGEQFMVYVLEQGTVFKGFGAIRSDLSRKENDQFVVTGLTIGELSRKANEQIASIKPGLLDNKIEETSFEIRVTGIVEFISTPYMDNNEMKTIFTVRETKNGTSMLYRFRTGSRLLAENLIGVSHTVVVTGQTTSTHLDIIADVSTIINTSYPPKLIPTPLLRLTPTAVP